MKKIVALCLLILIAACSKEKELGNMVVQGTIKGLKKGTLFLQKMKDTSVISVDSIQLFNNDAFVLTDHLESPEMYYLTLDGNENSISFFGQKGVITINDKLDKFGVQPEIEGSENQKIFEEYKKMARKFQGKQLDLLAENMQAQKDNDLKKSELIRTKSENQVRKKYIYTINFALNHSDSEAAAYITLTELVNANIKYLDSIHKSLSAKVKNSTYGKKLDQFITTIKKTETTK